ncbi:uncharacterized protein LOC109713908 isoform X1 [Ananas comosus]|uniref:Uncharacterized protein LOC109713908 isoform X1 n=2 Tax=Ananas comosus TaxID=4615 RepID=A0A6P5FCV6_ANACO|nr:uncharacterized protein LOC109713908 isoform X1 [Ananas comosus]
MATSVRAPTSSPSSSPSSLQLRFARRIRASPSSVILKIRASDRRIRLVFACGEADRGRGEYRSWSKSAGGSPDSFAGWSGSESGGGGDSKKSGGFGGALGAGLAGVFFAAGVTFAALSLKGRSTSGVKQQMEPLSNEQSVLINNDDNPKVDEVGNASNDVLQNSNSTTLNSWSENETGIDRDLSVENIEDSNETISNSIDNSEACSISNTKPDSDDVDAVNADQYDQNVTSDANDVPSSFSPEFPAHAIDLSSDIPSLKDSVSNEPSGSFGPSIVDDVTLVTDTHYDSSSLTNHVSGHQVGGINLAEIFEVDDRSTTFSGLENENSVDTLKSNISSLESDDVVDTLVKLENVVDVATFVSKDQDVEQPEMLELPTSGFSRGIYEESETFPAGIVNSSDFDVGEDPCNSINPHPSGRSVNETVVTVGHPVSITKEISENVLKIESQLDKSQLFESLAAEKSFSRAGIPAPAPLSAALQVPPGKVLIPAAVDQVQEHALAALQVLKVIEADARPVDLCTRREYARWLVSGSSALSRNTTSKVYPAMYIENLTELAFDDVTPEDPDFPYIQGLAEAGLISSKLSRSVIESSADGQQDSFLFCPESPLSRQDLVSWKMALDKSKLPEVDRNTLYQSTGYIDIDKINPDAWPALVADLSAGEQSITALAFGYTRLFQPDKPVTKAQAAVALSTGDASEVVSEELARIEAEKLAETAVNAHTALVAQVEKDLNASFEKELLKEREKIEALEKLAEEARIELEKLRREREEENNALIKGRAAVESEMEVLSRLRHEVEEQLQSLMSDKAEISFERERINKLRKEAENENQVIVQLQYELEVERKALSMARAWAEEEAKRAREQARALEEARDSWERQGIKVVIDEDLQDAASSGVTWVTAGKETQVEETVNRAESLVEKLKAMAAEIKLRSSAVIEKIIQKIVSLISTLKKRAAETLEHSSEVWSDTIAKARKSVGELQGNAYVLGSTVQERARRVADECKEGMDKISQRFRT